MTPEKKKWIVPNVILMRGHAVRGGLNTGAHEANYFGSSSDTSGIFFITQTTPGGKLGPHKAHKLTFYQS